MLHLTLLHGIVNSNYLPSSDYAFIEPAWSLSLEWQFYLIAPLVVVKLNKADSSLWIIAISLGIATLYDKGGDGLLSNEAHYFFVGIISYFIYKKINYFSSTIFLATTIISFAILMRSIPLIIWACVFSTIVNKDTKLGGMVYQLLNHKSLMYFGKISFPIYIVHSLVIHFSLALPYFGLKHSNDYALYILVVSIMGTWFFSHLLHISLEKPGINLGRILTKKWKNKG